MKGGVDHWRLSYLGKLITWWPFNIAILLVAIAVDWRPFGLESPYILLAFNWWVAATLYLDFILRGHKWRQDQAERLNAPVSPNPNRLWKAGELPKITKKAGIVIGAYSGAILWHFMLMPFLILSRDEELIINKWVAAAEMTPNFVVGGCGVGFVMWFIGGRGYREWTDSTGQFFVETELFGSTGVRAVRSSRFLFPR